MKTKNKAYFPHIDALRAFAVVSVIVFHLNENYLPGGFVGVDVFFVISGFLITGQILNTLKEGQFTFADFYSRRIKRIAPASLIVILITILLSNIFFLPEHNINVGWSAIWSSLSVPNIYFWKFTDTSYFADSNFTQPLLHYWSLGVEEQFYLIWPLVLFFMFPLGKPKFIIALILASIILSTALAEMLIKQHHSLVYYTLPFRAGELLVGSLLSALLHFGMIKKSLNSDMFFLASIVLLILSCFYITSTDIFPGLLSLMPTLSAALFIWSGFNQSSLLVSFVSQKPVLFIGKVSFSAYLVHWPIFSFYKYGYGSPSIFAEICLLVCVFILAWLNWKFVEEKYRYTALELRPLLNKQLFIPILVLVSIALFQILSDGYGTRVFSNYYKESLKSVSTEVLRPSSYDYVCQVNEVSQSTLDNTMCILGRNNSSTETLLWGDSNAAHYVGILKKIALIQGWSFRNVAHSACPPVFFNLSSYVSEGRFEECQASIKFVESKLNAFSTIILSSAYPHYLNLKGTYLSDFFNTIRRLRETHSIIIIGSVPVFDSFDKQCKAKSISYPLSDCNYNSSQSRVFYVNEQLKLFSSEYDNVHYISFLDWLCSTGCTPYKHGETIYFDRNHLDVGKTEELYELREKDELFKDILTTHLD